MLMLKYLDTLFQKNRGQWPYRPASKERAMTNRPMMLYDFNFFGIRVKESKIRSYLGPGLNPGPLAPQSDTLTTMPSSLKEFVAFYFEVVSFCSVFGHFRPLNGLRGHKQPRNQIQ